MADIRTKLLLGAAVGGLALVSMPVAAQDAAISAQAASQAAPIEERQSYALRLMTQIYNGAEDVSHTQLLGVGRVRMGNRSLTQFDYGDGAVVIQDDDGQMAASRFLNITDTEKFVVYNYDDKTIQGDGEIAYFHNNFVRQWLDKGPALGTDAAWTQRIPVGALGLAALSGGDVEIELSRHYFTHDGIAMVLLEYAIPAFTYRDDQGRTVVHWARGISVTDPGFGMIYFNAALHRAVATGEDGTSTPYRFARSMVAANQDGSAMIDYREMEQLRPYIGPLFGAEAMRVVPSRKASKTLDERPLVLGRRLDVMALTLAENGANETGAAAAAQTASSRGGETNDPNIENAANRVNQGNQAATGLRVLTGSTATTSAGDLVSIPNTQIIQQANALVAETEAASRQLTSLQSTISSLENQLKNVSVTVEQSEQALRAANTMKREQQELGLLDRALDLLATQIDDLTEAGKAVPKSLADRFDDMLDSRAYQLERLETAFESYADIADRPGALKVVPDLSQPQAARLVSQLNDAKQEMGLLEQSMQALGSKGQSFAQMLKSAPVAKVNELLNALADSKAGKLLDGLGLVLNGYSIYKASGNIETAATTNIGSGNLPLTRDYSGSARAQTIGIGMEMVGLLGNAATLNFPGFVTDATAITLGSISDIVIAAKGVVDVQQTQVDILQDGVLLQIERTKQVIAQEKQKMAELRARPVEGLLYTDEPANDGGVTDPNWVDPRIDPDTGLPKPGYWQYLKDNNPGTLASYGIDPEAPVGGWPGGIGPEHKPKPVAGPRPPQPDPGPTDEELIAGLAEEINKPQYPTAKPRDPATTQTPKVVKPSRPAQGFVVETPQEKRLRETREENAKAAEDLKAYQDEKLANREETSILDGDYEMRISTLETSELVVSTFDLKPVTFTPVDFTPPAFDEDGDLFVKNEDGTTSLKKVGPDDFELTPFDPPEISKFPPTDPDDTDGYPGTGEYPAFGFENMSGTLNVDLSKWEEWLTTQDIKKLIRLAIAAGYPYSPGDDGLATLAIALNDAENIIRMSQDSGYRQWANQAPSCGGYVGCGPQYLGRWAMKRSIVALGDILVQSRGIFSSGGFSDIGISGFNLAYMLRDFGIQDGDLIDVEIQQFGRTIAKLESHFLTTAGDNFSVNLRPGVASMVVTALNEGSAPPNTAEVTIDNVVRGDARQTYNLNTGQTATLRIEANATPE